MLSPNTQATLLLTAPLIAGRDDTSIQLLTASEYVKLRRLLATFNLQPAALLDNSSEWPTEIKTILESDRYQQLLARGFQLTLAVEQWQSREIWVAGHTDEEYPQKFISHLKENAPAIVYGCGDPTLLDSGGLAVVGSREVNRELVEFTESVGGLAAQAQRTLISGGARGIDQAAMRGAVEAGGKVVGVLADSLERAVVARENRELLESSSLTLLTVFDPSAGFNVGHAMQRNRLIYALADAALVVNSDLGKGGTWAGAIEQLEKLHFAPIYVRSTGEIGEGLKALMDKGGLPWPSPTTPEELEDVLAETSLSSAESEMKQLSFL